jgi:type II secretory pathway pseudopilin PulG
MFLAAHPARVSAPERLRAERRVIGARLAREAGETLVEILIAIVVIGIVGSAGFYAISVGAQNSKSHRDLVTADALLRNYAEAATQSVRTTCNGTNTTFTVPNQLSSGQAAAGWQLSATGLNCPGASNVQQVDITATVPTGLTKTLSIEVRSP